MKRMILVALCFFLLLSTYNKADAVSTNASSAILMDAESRRVLYEQNVHERRLIASITKLMTALVAVEHIQDLEQKITVQPDWAGIEGSSIYLKANEEVSLKELLYGLLLQSGNDAAVAIAGCVAGGIEPFAEMMNHRAAELGMTNSHFTNPSGLNEEGHYSTAYDMALLACACLENEVVAQICATQSITVGNRTFYNHNKLLNRYEGCVGMKTGYTELAGRTLVSAAVREGQTLVCVTLNDGNDWNDHEKLLDYGFETYHSRILCRQGDFFGAVKVNGSLIPCLPVISSRQVSYPMKAGETVTVKVEIAHELQAPVKDAMSVGWVSWLLNGEVIAEAELLCSGSAENHHHQKENILKRLFRTQRRVTLAPNGMHLI